MKQLTAYLIAAASGQILNEELVRELNSRGVTVSRLDTQSAGESMSDRIERNIANSDWVLALATSRALQSANFSYELGFALARGKPVLVVASEKGVEKALAPAVKHVVTVVQAGKRVDELADRIVRVFGSGSKVSPNRQDFSLELARLVNERKISLFTLAKTLAISRNGVSKILRGETRPTVSTFGRLVTALDQVGPPIASEELRRLLQFAAADSTPPRRTKRRRRSHKPASA